MKDLRRKLAVRNVTKNTTHKDRLLEVQQFVFLRMCFPKRASDTQQLALVIKKNREKLGRLVWDRKVTLPSFAWHIHNVKNITKR
jgi:hypothetical protein